MKILLSLIILFIPFSILAKQICLAPSGCSIEIDTGFCPKCIEVEEEQPIIKEEKVIVVEPCDDDMLPPGCRWNTDI